LIAHQEVRHPNNKSYKILRPQQLPFISYAWEWSFSMLKDAALCTLENALEALSFGMILKDANTFNIQFLKGKPILIDTLSFEHYDEQENWIAYRQFCEHFLAPLLLMKYTHASLNKLLVTYPNGIPLSVCADLLPWKARLNLHVNLHIILQSKINSSPQKKENKSTFSKQKMLTLLRGLYQFVSSLQIKKEKTVWDDYYHESILSQAYLDEKKQRVYGMLQKIKFQTMLDLGANDGVFTMLYKNTDKQLIALDEDRNCIEKLYSDCKNENIQNIIPLIVDLTAPSPGVGWNLEERTSIWNRVKPDVTLALALIHHLAIANNIPLDKIISFFYTLSDYLLIEFVPKEDPKVQELLAYRIDVFDGYHVANFKLLIAPYYETIQETQIANTERTLFLLRRKN
jgi:ribosomal protein L11 methylase PrmA